MDRNLPFGLGIVSFALDGGFDRPEPEKLVDKVDQLDIPGQGKYIELLVMPTTEPKIIENIAGVIHQANYGITICAFRPGSETPDMMSADKEQVEAALSQVYHIMECAEAAGATRIGGPWIRNHGNLARGDGSYLGYALKEVAQKAEQMDLYISTEMLNAFEMAGFNNLATTLPIIQAVGSDHVLIHYDTAHSYREEPSIIPAATELYISGKFGHAHISEIGRGPIGDGPVSRELVPFLHNLAALGYGKKGEVVIAEIFHPSMWDAVKRVDSQGVMQRTPAEQDTSAFEEAKSSFQYIAEACKRVGR